MAISGTVTGIASLDVFDDFLIVIPEFDSIVAVILR